MIHDFAQHLVAVSLFVTHYDAAEAGVVPDGLPLDFGDRDVEFMVDSIAYAIEYSAFVLERHSVINIEFAGEDTKDHGTGIRLQVINGFR